MKELSTDLDRKYPSMRFKPVQEGGWFNHLQFYLVYLGISLTVYFGLLWAIVNAEKIDRFFYDIFKSIWF